MDSTVDPVVVAVRVRPLSDKESKENAFCIIEQVPQDPKVLSVAGKGYAFDCIFMETCEQVRVYEESVRPAVRKLCAGFNCAVIAYGQTGTGKTYTMGTDPKTCNQETAGIISRAVEEVLSKCNDEDLNVSVEISFMEIYNEEVYDLLANQTTKLLVQAFCVQNLTRVRVRTCEEAIQQLEFGTTNRHTRATKLNAHSSRSHAIFTIYYHQQVGEQVVLSRLDLVDLAGSEGVRHTGNRGLALSEANNINHGLLNLRNVISILSTNTKDYVPYRSSTLTTVLKDSLGRESCVTMIACISPSSRDIAQTVTTLRFVDEAKKVMSKPRINQILSKYKESNPQAFEYLADVAPYIPPTPATRNLYKMNSTPLSRARKPFTPLNVSNVTTFSSAGVQDYFKKPHLGVWNESPSNSSVISDFSTSAVLDMSTALSPVVKKHMHQMEERLEEKISIILRTELKRPQVRGNDEVQSHSPMQQMLDRKVNSAVEQTRSMLREDFKAIVDELKTYVQQEIALQSVQRTRNNVATDQQDDTTNTTKNVRCKLTFPGEEDSLGRNSPSLDSELLSWPKLSPSNDDCLVSFSQQETVRRYTRRSARIAACRLENLPRLALEDDGSKRAVRRSVRIADRSRCDGVSLQKTLLADDQLPFNLSALSTVRRSKRTSMRARADGSCYMCSPPAVMTEFHCERLSIGPASDDAGEDVFCPVRSSTVRRSVTLLNKDTDEEPKLTASARGRRSIRPQRRRTDKTPVSSPKSSAVRRRRSARLAGKTPAYSDEASQRLSSLRSVRKLSFKPALMVSPKDLGQQTAVNMRDKFEQKVLRLLNGSLKDLCNLSTVGPKTAIIIYNYRLLHDCQFKRFGDLQEIPGLPKSYYHRFMKANNLF